MRLVVKPVGNTDVSDLVGRKLVARLVNKTDSSEIIWMETAVVSASVRPDTNWNVEVNWTETVPYQVVGYATNYQIAYVMVESSHEMANLAAMQEYLNTTYPLNNS